jgi:hypothetical protein
MKIKVKDKSGKMLPDERRILEALGFGELYGKLSSVGRHSLAKALAVLADEDPQQLDNETWRAYLADGVTLFLKRDEQGDWTAEFVLPFEYREDTAFLLGRVEKLTQLVKGTECAIEALNSRIDGLEEVLRDLLKEGKGRRGKSASERLAETLERLLELLEERGEGGNEH